MAVGVVPHDWKVNDSCGHEVILQKLIDAAEEILQVQRGSEEVTLKMGIHTGARGGGCHRPEVATVSTLW